MTNKNPGLILRAYLESVTSRPTELSAFPGEQALLAVERRIADGLVGPDTDDYDAGYRDALLDVLTVIEGELPQ